MLIYFIKIIIISTSRNIFWTYKRWVNLNNNLKIKIPTKILHSNLKILLAKILQSINKANNNKFKPIIVSRKPKIKYKNTNNKHQIKEYVTYREFRLIWSQTISEGFWRSTMLTESIYWSKRNGWEKIE